MFRKSLTYKELSALCRQFHSILESGINISDGIELLKGQFQNRIIKSSLSNIKNEINRGNTLYNSFKLYPSLYPDFMLSMINVGEQSGNLEYVFKTLSLYYNKMDSLIKKIQSILIYPKMIIAVTAVVMCIFIFNIVPMFVNVMVSMNIHVSSGFTFLSHLSSFIRNNFILTIFFIAVLVFIYFVFIKDKIRNVFDTLKLKIPIVKDLFMEFYEIQFSKSMYMLISSGINIINAIEITKNAIRNSTIKEELKKVEEEVNAGESLFKSLEKYSVFDHFYNSFIRVGEETGRLDDNLIKTGEMLQEEIDQKISKITVVIEPTVLIAISLIVFTIIFNIIMPIFNFIEDIKI